MTPPDASPAPTTEHRPTRFTLVPDDYHVPWAGTAADGRRFFLSDELFVPGRSAYVGLFLWDSSGVFEEIRVDEVGPDDDAERLVASRLAELGGHVLEPVEVEPFTREIDGVTFGWPVDRYDDGTWFIRIEPGDFIAYYAPWDGLEYDT
ncbi:hypothetical protein GHK92_01335 [Nocardioides sp. dk4132]|uniref:hypothetical protein n=1 Tax=unclassified Nocardioides TaxID=2615069 RepID=UPI001297CD5B|nr:MULTISPECIES: hypothetical protein [unclassified Nocardioides]MQW74510.1 hypothetical protein [Nocardioides sp. dk4132]QGA06438.1 hypothetical protein GFH29_02780 [Nocardioides sp. dk884]